MKQQHHALNYRRIKRDEIEDEIIKLDLNITKKD